MGLNPEETGKTALIADPAVEDKLAPFGRYFIRLIKQTGIPKDFGREREKISEESS